MELREQRGFDAIPCLIAGPHAVAKRLDDVIGRHADASCPGLDHLQHRMQHTDHGAEGPILAFGEAAKTIKVAEQFVRAIDEMNDHAFVRGAARKCVEGCGPTGTKPYQALATKSNEALRNRFVERSMTGRISAQPVPSPWQPLPADSSVLPLIGARTEVDPRFWRSHQQPQRTQPRSPSTAC